MNAVAALGLFCAAILSSASRCDPQYKAPTRSSRSSKHIAVVGVSESDPSWEVLRTVVGQVVSEVPGASVSFFAPKDDSPSAQQAVLEEVRTADIHAVCVMPLDPEAIESSVARLMNDGKPVVLLGMDAPKSKRSVYVGPSELAIGQAAAIACARVLPADRRTVMLLHAGVDHPSYGARYSGFKQQLRGDTAIELFKELDCGANDIKGQQMIRRQSRLYPRIGGWVLIDDWPLRRLGEGESLIPLGCSLIVCRDDPRYFDALRRGDIDALVAYDLYEAIDQAVRATIRRAEDRSDEPIDLIILPSEIVTSEDLAWHEARWRLWRKGIRAPARQRE